MSNTLKRRSTVLILVCLGIFAPKLTNVEGEQAALTSTTFVTVRVGGHGPFVRGLPNPRPPQLPDGAPEARPASEDPGGNWSSPAEGFQLSARLATNRFHAGEPVVIYAILRNISSTSLYYTAHDGIHTKFCNFEVWDAEGERLEPIPHVPLFESWLRVLVREGQQHRTWARLEKAFELKSAGRYKVRAVAPVPVLGTSRPTLYTNLITKTFEFEILPSPAPAEKQEE